MRIYMQTPPSTATPPRFCHLILQKDLLDGWTVINETGNQGRAGRVRKQHFEDRGEATEAIEKQRNMQIKRGFKVVFMATDTH